MTHIFDPILGGNVRTAVAVLTAIATVLSSLASTSALPWVASLSVAVNGILAVVTHLTPIGTTPATAATKAALKP